MNTISLSELLGKTYDAPVTVNGFWVAQIQDNPSALILEVDCELWNEPRMKTFVEITK